MQGVLKYRRTKQAQPTPKRPTAPSLVAVLQS
jgi:hypothetical protein